MAKTALIVDDDAASLRLFNLLLDQAGISVIEARNGLEALRLAFHYRPDLVITDIRLPLASGVEVIRQIRRHAGLGQVPIIVVTAVAAMDQKNLAVAAGADAFILKPISVLPFLETVRACLDPYGLKRGHG